MTRLPLSACLITQDCARSLADTLASLAFCDDIVVVDSGSRDDTVAVAQAHGARVIEQAWLGFGGQKQFAVDQARHDWVLCIDSDEVVTPALQAAIRGALSAPAAAAYAFPRCNRFLGRYLRHGEGYPDLSLRLFDRRQARWSDDPVHEKVVCTGTVATLTGDLLHHSEDSLSRYLGKQDRCTSLAAHQLHARGRQASAGKLLLSPVVRFVRFYLLRGGYRDGIPGLIHIAIGAWTSLLKYAKLYELQHGTPQALPTAHPADKSVSSAPNPPARA